MPPIPQALRQRIIEVAKGRCGYCQIQEEITGIPLEVEHIIPVVLGGASTESNLWLACSNCNRHKGKSTHAIDRETGQYVSLFNPRYQSWDEHFQWIEGGLYISGTTPTGRVTVVTLQMNNPLVVRARRRWIMAGWHPPHE